jgi:GAF domain-containing protein
MRPGSIDPAGVMVTAEDFPAALLLALSTATATASAPAGLIVRVGESRSQVFGTQGQNTERLLGQSIRDGDPSLSAAQRGAIVMGEAGLGEAETCIADRLVPGAAPPQGVAMVPLLVDGELVASLEIAHSGRPFRAREVARVEDVMEALAARAVVMGWFS